MSPGAFAALGICLTCPVDWAVCSLLAGGKRAENVNQIGLRLWQGIVVRKESNCYNRIDRDYIASYASRRGGRRARAAVLPQLPLLSMLEGISPASGREVIAPIVAVLARC